MKCDIIIKRGEKQVKMQIDSQSGLPLTDDEIQNAIDNAAEEDKNELKSLLTDISYNRYSYKPATLNSIMSRDGIQPNTNLSYLKKQFPDVVFPENVEASVLLIRNLNINSKNIYGRFINSSGLELFIVNDSEDDMERLAAFLRVRKQIQEGIPIDENSEEYKSLKECFSAFKEKEKNLQQQKKDEARANANKKISEINSDEGRNEKQKKAAISRVKSSLQKEEENIDKSEVTDLQSFLLNFLYNKSEYYSLTIGSGANTKSVYSTLDDLCRKLKKVGDGCPFNNQVVDMINHGKIINDRYNDERLVTFELLYGGIRTFTDICTRLNINTLEEFVSFFNQTDYSKDLSKIYKYEGDVLRLEILVNNLFKLEPEFPWKFSEISKTGKSFYIKYTKETLEDRYGYSYDTIYQEKTIIDDDFYGYKIYKLRTNGVDKYVAYRGYISQHSTERVFDSENEIKKYIKDRVNQQKISANSFKEFKGLSSRTINKTYLDLAIHSIVESIDISIDNSVKPQDQAEYDFLYKSGQTLQEFWKIIKSWEISDDLKNNIIDKMNTPEKAYLFIQLMNERFGGTRKESEIKTDNTGSTSVNKNSKNAGHQLIELLVSNIADAPKRRYFIDQKTNLGDGFFSYRIIPYGDPITFKNYQTKLKSERQPIVGFISALQKTLFNNFGLTINTLTSEEIKSKFKDVDANNTKAFVRNGQIYINTTIAEVDDPIHEFTHMLLGIIKANPSVRENYEVLMYVVSQDRQGQEEMGRLRNTYPDVSEMDLREEAFVSLFSKYVMSQMPVDEKSVFETTAVGAMKTFGEDIFHTKIPSVNKFYQQSLYTVFKRFSGQVSQLLSNQSKVDFKSTEKQRRISNWINTNIKEGNIEENCK